MKKLVIILTIYTAMTLCTRLQYAQTVEEGDEPVQVSTTEEGPSLESAQKKFDAGDYDGAEEELRPLLGEGENVEAESLLSRIEKARITDRADMLTEKALIEIEKRDFESAFGYLEEAILLDPENEQARSLYLSIYEIAEIEEKTIEEVIEKAETPAGKEEELVVATEQPAPVPGPAPVAETPVSGTPVSGTPAEAGETGEEVAAAPAPEQAGQEEGTVSSAGGEVVVLEDDEGQKQIDLFVKVSTAYLFARSDHLGYIDSDVSLFGGRIDGRYYFPFLEERLGVSADYAVYPVKASGDENIAFSLHKITGSARFRTFLFQTEKAGTTLGARLNYQAFILKNSEERGVYNFTRVYGPSIGLFISDPVLARFLAGKIFSNLGFELELNYLTVIGGGDGSPVSPELFVGGFYALDSFTFGAGFRRFAIKNETVKETYNNIEVSAGYRF